jgi:hypothetical protein
MPIEQTIGQAVALLVAFVIGIAAVYHVYQKNEVIYRAMVIVMRFFALTALIDLQYRLGKVPAPAAVVRGP